MTQAHFTPELFEFLLELRTNNNREWFQANKGRYERHVKEPLLQFIQDFEPSLHSVSTRFIADARANGGSMFRIYRDVRFSKDKSPYKTQAAVQFRHEAGKSAHAPGSTCTWTQTRYLRASVSGGPTHRLSPRYETRL